MILKLESNPGLVKEGDLVLYLTHRKSGKTIAHLGECVKERNGKQVGEL